VGTRPHSRLAHPITGHPSCEGRSSRRYAFLARGLLRGVYRRIGEDMALTAPPSGAVLDVGTGPGVQLAEIAAQRPDLQVTGIDPSTDMVTAANRTISKYGERVTARVGDVTNLDFPDASFDLIVTTFSMHHWDDVPAPVPELARVLRPGGALYVYDLPRAPFDTLDAAAQTNSLLTVRPVQPQRHPHRPSTHPPMHPPRPDHRHHPR
jgi:ubiquinone/menaquinone biosynthesis C-methylase UbiE